MHTDTTVEVVVVICSLSTSSPMCIFFFASFSFFLSFFLLDRRDFWSLLSWEREGAAFFSIFQHSSSDSSLFVFADVLYHFDCQKLPKNTCSFTSLTFLAAVVQRMSVCRHSLFLPFDNNRPRWQLIGARCAVLAGKKLSDVLTVCCFSAVIRTNYLDDNFDCAAAAAADVDFDLHPFHHCHFRLHFFSLTLTLLIGAVVCCDRRLCSFSFFQYWILLWQQ